MFKPHIKKTDTSICKKILFWINILFIDVSFLGEICRLVNSYINLSQLLPRRHLSPIHLFIFFSIIYGFKHLSSLYSSGWRHMLKYVIKLVLQGSCIYFMSLSYTSLYVIHIIDSVYITDAKIL